jgi:FemAB-related protein (PEP-CTERM system-associated)
MGRHPPEGAAAVTTVQPYDETQRASWDAFVASHDEGTPLHLIAWKQVVERSFGFEPHYLMALDERKTVGVLPLFMVRNAVLGRALISTPFATRGGLCATTTETASLLREHARQLGDALGASFIELRGRCAAPGSEYQVERSRYVNFGRCLPASDSDLMRSLPAKTRYMIRRGMSGGLVSSESPDLLDIVHAIYASSVHHLGTPVFGRRHFRNVLEAYGTLARCRVVWSQGRPLAGALSFAWRHTMWPYYGGGLREARRQAANNFLYWEVMRGAIENRLSAFDFGRSRVGSGSAAFKSRGGMEVTALEYEYHMPPGRPLPHYSPANPGFALATAAWKKLPLWTANLLGPYVVRLFP